MTFGELLEQRDQALTGHDVKVLGVSGHVSQSCQAVVVEVLVLYLGDVHLDDAGYNQNDQAAQRHRRKVALFVPPYILHLLQQ